MLVLVREGIAFFRISHLLRSALSIKSGNACILFDSAGDSHSTKNRCLHYFGVDLISLAIKKLERM
ncbi:hypothetical protein ANCCAN_05838 [Ancylostoma caninum]|uniref:Uncharacterized protein n=1 Tax=Ancylostoma caninum TaxID=29170 RepID=A0A368GUV7_ANCCA|nr:hypothetical protein ANCCAN_05838 [Ancylostoma caninum]